VPGIEDPSAIDDGYEEVAGEERDGPPPGADPRSKFGRGGLEAGLRDALGGAAFVMRGGADNDPIWHGDNFRPVACGPLGYRVDPLSFSTPSACSAQDFRRAAATQGNTCAAMTELPAASACIAPVFPIMCSCGTPALSLPQ
jgi:hypothetical protein